MATARAATPSIQRQPAPPAPTAGDDKAPEKKDDSADARQREAARQVADHPLIAGLISDIYKDLRFGTDFSADERKKFKLKGTESASYFGLFSASVLPIGGAGGLQYGPDFGTSLSTFGKYRAAVEPLLPPSSSLTADLASRMIGLRVDEYFASDTFMKRLKDNYQTVLFLAMVAQIGVLAKDRAATPSADAGGLSDETWNADLLLAKAMVSLIFKEKLKAPGIFDVGPLLTPSHPYYASDSYFGGNLPSGLNVDAASGLSGSGRSLHLGATANIPKFVAPDDKLDAADLDDPRKYRGWQGSVWGDYQQLQPTPELASQGRVADRRFRAGALFGSEGLFILGDVGGHYSGPDASQLTSMFFTEGLAYAPAGGPLKKVGFKLTHMSWDAGDSLAPPDASGAPAAGFANRVQPFGSFDVKLGGSSSLGLGASAGITSSAAKSLDLSDLRGDVSFTYLGAKGSTDLPVFRVELSGSASRLDYFDPKSPMLYGVRGKMQFDNLFYGAQVNVGADKIPAGRAAQLGDPRSEGPGQIAGGNSVLIVFGVLK